MGIPGRLEEGKHLPLCHLDLATPCFSVPFPLKAPFSKVTPIPELDGLQKGEKKGPRPGRGSRQVGFKAWLLLTC